MKRLVYLVIFLCLAIVSYSQDIGSIINEVNLDSLVKTVREITGEEYTTVNGTQVLIRNRQSSNPGNEVAKDYIKERLIKRGLDVQDQAYSSTGHNVIATQTGINLPDSIYIICAHYDAMADYCADDNASGIAAVLEAARILSKYCFDYTIKYIAFDQEEQGQIGSSYYASQAYSNSYKIAGVLNMDMIAYDSNDDRRFEIHTNSLTSSQALKNALVSTISNYSLSLSQTVVNPGATASDHGPFWARGFGASCVSELFFHGDANPYYHTSSDRISRFNLNYFKELAKLNIGTLAKVSKLNPSCQQGSFTLSVSPDNQNVSASAGSTDFTISSNTSWTITDNAAWLTVSPASGTGDATVTATFTANSSTSPRTATITVSGSGVSDQQVTVIQSGIITLSVTPSNREVEANAGSTTFTVSSSTSWTISDDADWLTVNPGSGNGNATFTAYFTANTSTSARTATITVSASGASPQQVTVYQKGIVVLSVTPSARDVSYDAGSTSFTITSNTSWVVIDDADWLTITPSSGSGNGTITANYTSNTSTSSRIATITVSGTGAPTQQVTVSQSGISTLSVIPSYRNVEPDAGSTSFTISSNTTWTVTDDADWLTISPSGGSGNGTITATFTANSLPSVRIATITISADGTSPQQVLVEQSGIITLTVTPISREASAEAGSTTFSISSNTTWTVTDDADWLTITPVSGNGDGSITVTYTANESPAARTANITVTGSGAVSPRVVSLTQNGFITLNITPAYKDVTADAGSTTFTVSSNTSWTISDDAGWLTISPSSGSGNGTVTAVYTANSSASARTAIISISASGATSQQAILTQSGVIILSVTPSNREVVADAGSTTFSISSNTSWTITDDADWLTLSPSAGGGNGTFTASFTANTSSTARIAVITVSASGTASQQVTVTQNGMYILSVSPSNRVVEADAGSTSFAISSNTSWALTSDATWLTLNPASGIGDATIIATFTTNTEPLARTATITITGAGVVMQQVSVTQNGIITLSVSPDNWDVTADAGSRSFAVSSNTSWTAIDDAFWLTLSPAGGTGNGTVTATYTANTSSIARTATITISGTGAESQQVTITQSGLPLLSVTPPNREVESDAGTTTFEISSNTIWTIADDADWLTISPSSGSGSGTLTATYSANTTSAPRVATITVSGTGVGSQQVTVIQNPVITLSVTPLNSEVGPDAGSTTFTISSTTSWTLDDDADWLTLSPLTGSGNGTFIASFTANASANVRIATITINGEGATSQQVTVTQNGMNTLVVTPSARNVGSEAGSTTFTISSNTSWVIDDNASWLTVSPANGSGDETITATFTQNEFISSRTATITISGTGVSSRYVTVTQSGTVTLSVTPSDRQVSAETGTTTFTVSSNTAWTVTDDASWLTLNIPGGNGNGIITATYTANTLAAARTATITISATGAPTQQVTVTQNGVSFLVVSPSSLNVTADASSVIFSLISNTSWSVTDDATWLTVSPSSGNGNATITVAYNANTSTAARTATITVSGAGVNPRYVTVTQSGIITLSVTPSSRQVSAEAGTTTFTVSSNTAWTVSDNASWLTLNISGATGNSIITATYSANTSATARTATITVSATGAPSQQVTVTQNGTSLLSVAPSDINVEAAAGNTQFTINSNISWTITDDASWLSVNTATGSGNATLTVTYAANTSTSARTATITISGAGVSSRHVTITQSGTIMLSVTPSARLVSAEAGTTIFTISSNTAWTVSDNAIWLTLNISNGSGNGTVTATCTANTSSTSRTATITVSATGAPSQQVTVTQNSVPLLTVSPSSLSVTAGAGSITFSLTSNTSWSITRDATWLTVSPASGNGNATITVTYTANTSAADRTATIIISGTGVSSRYVTITQSGIITLSVTPSARQVSAEAGTTTFTVSSNTSWTVSDDASWLTLNISNGIGNSIITATYSASTLATARTATITVSATGASSRQVTVTQNGVLLLSVAPSDINIEAEEGTTQFAISSNIPWTITDDASWLTVNPVTGIGNATITVTYTVNSSAVARTATIIISGTGVSNRQVTIIQAGMNSLSVVPSVREVQSETGSTTFNISSNTSWTVTDDADWLTISPSDGISNGMITATFTANTLPAIRTTTITVSANGVSDQYVTLVQSGIKSLSVAPLNCNVDYDAGSTSFTITSNTSWTITVDADWLTVIPETGNESGILTTTFTANTSPESRTAIITVSTPDAGAHQVTVTQFGTDRAWDLKQNYPNPFTQNTTIEFFIPETCRVEINIFDIHGIIMDVVLYETLEKGWHSIDWTPPDYFYSGIYFYQLRTDKPQAVRKMLYVDDGL